MRRQKNNLPSRNLNLQQRMEMLTRFPFKLRKDLYQIRIQSTFSLMFSGSVN